MPRQLARFLAGHEVRTADELGWAELSNGALIGSAEASGFNVFITADKNIRYQQNFAGRRIGIVVISTQRLDILQDNLDALSAVIARAGEGSFCELNLPRPVLRRRPPPAQLP